MLGHLLTKFTLPKIAGTEFFRSSNMSTSAIAQGLKHMLVKKAKFERYLPSTNPEIVETREGTVGASSFRTPMLEQIEQRMPTPATMKQLFDGVPYEDLPVAHIKATPNNTLINVVDWKTNRVILYTSARLEGFKNAKKKSILAGQTTGAGAGQKLLRRGVQTVRVSVKGLGYGRVSAMRGMAAAGVNIVSITDFTPLKELGPRPKKVRRI